LDAPAAPRGWEPACMSWRGRTTRQACSRPAPAPTDRETLCLLGAAQPACAVQACSRCSCGGCWRLASRRLRAPRRPAAGGATAGGRGVGRAPGRAVRGHGAARVGQLLRRLPRLARALRQPPAAAGVRRAADQGAGDSPAIPLGLWPASTADGDWRPGRCSMTYTVCSHALIRGRPRCPRMKVRRHICMLSVDRGARRALCHARAVRAAPPRRCARAARLSSPRARPRAGALAADHARAHPPYHLPVARPRARGRARQHRRVTPPARAPVQACALAALARGAACGPAAGRGA